MERDHEKKRSKLVVRIRQLERDNQALKHQITRLKELQKKRSKQIANETKRRIKSNQENYHLLTRKLATLERKVNERLNAVLSQNKDLTHLNDDLEIGKETVQALMEDIKSLYAEREKMLNLDIETIVEQRVTESQIQTLAQLEKQQQQQQQQSTAVLNSSQSADHFQHSPMDGGKMVWTNYRNSGNDHYMSTDDDAYGTTIEYTDLERISELSGDEHNNDNNDDADDEDSIENNLGRLDNLLKLENEMKNDSTNNFNELAELKLKYNVLESRLELINNAKKREIENYIVKINNVNNISDNRLKDYLELKENYDKLSNKCKEFEKKQAQMENDKEIELLKHQIELENSQNIIQNYNNNNNNGQQQQGNRQLLQRLNKMENDIFDKNQEIDKLKLQVFKYQEKDKTNSKMIQVYKENGIAMDVNFDLMKQEVNNLKAQIKLYIHSNNETKTEEGNISDYITTSNKNARKKDKNKNKNKNKHKSTNKHKQKSSKNKKRSKKQNNNNNNGNTNPSIARKASNSTSSDSSTATDTDIDE